jgi:hypothetical protein
MRLKNNEKITCVGALRTARGLSLETPKKKGVWGAFLVTELGPCLEILVGNYFVVRSHKDLVQTGLSLCQKNTVVWGDYTYGY